MPTSKPACVVCRTPLVVERTFVQTGETVYGGTTPGHYRKAIHCPKCGLEYAHEPKENK
jgi:hypothetical protein